MRKNGFIISFMLLVFGIVMNCTTVHATEDSTSNMYIEPKVVVTAYEIVEGTVANGEEFTIKVQLTNMNKYASAYNIVTAMNSYNNNIVITEEKSNLVYFETIAAGETVEFLMSCKMLDVEDNGLTVLAFDSTYYNAYGYQYTVESKVALAVENQAQLEIPTIVVSENAVVGANALVSVRYSNTGKAKLKNIRMKIDGNIEDAQKVVDLGSLDAGAQKYIDYYVTLKETGNQKLQISFEYQDKGGNIQEIGPYEYSLNVYPYVISEETEYVVNTNKIKLGVKEIYMLVIGSILLLIMIITGLLKVRMKRSKTTRK